MFEIYRFDIAELVGFGLMLVRISTCMAAFPIFGSKNVPAFVKILWSLAIAFILFPIYRGQIVLPPRYDSILMILAAREALCGLFIGFLGRMMFTAVEMSGQIVSYSMGFSTVQLLNPTFGESGTMMDQFEMILATLLFLAVNGHYMFLEAIYESFKVAPVGQLAMNPAVLGSASQFVGRIFEIGIKLSAPMLAVILILNLAMGLISRMVPQINVFVVSLPVNILVGFFVMAGSIPLLLAVMNRDFSDLGGDIFQLIRAF